MKTTRLDLPVMASWMESNGRRLDCNPYLSGGFEARVLLERLKAEKQPLLSLTQNGMAGIFHAGREKRSYVDNPEYGVPFLGSTDILAADLSGLPFLSKKQVQKNPHFTVKEEWTLITRSGTVGRMAFVRPDMAGMACSEHVLQVAPDRTKIPPGYLYAYLSSRFGVSLITSGTYGSIIQHLEPNHIADLPVPRLGEAIEEEIHNLILEASLLRTKANIQLTVAIQKIEELAGLPPLLKSLSHQSLDISSTSSKFLIARLDGLFHSNYHKSALIPLLSLSDEDRVTIGEIANEVIELAKFKRVTINDPIHGVPFFGTSAIMWTDPSCSYYTQKKMQGINQYLIDNRTLLVPRSGQLNGIIGHIVFPYGQVIGGAVTEGAIRIKADSPTIAGYIFVALSSEYGVRQMKARTFGSSIPQLDVKTIQEIIIPRLSSQQMEVIGNQGWQVSKDRNMAIEKELQARNILNQLIEAKS
jgi:type I restriction enzyme, S subunit